MAVIRALITLHTADNNPANFITNSWHFDDDDGGLTNWVSIKDALQAFYVDIQAYFGPSIVQNGHEVEMYRMSDPEPRVPVYSFTWNLGAAGTGSALPFEVACVLSFQGDPSSGVPQARRRGRIYTGPFNTTANNNGVPSTTFTDVLVDAADTLLTTSDAADWTWVAFSRVNFSAVPVTNGWVDNAWDTQRRRGIAWTSRSVFP